jgi:putative ABC transport system ATP-binding protein
MNAQTPAKAAGHVLRARALTKIYGEGASAVHALRGVDLDLQPKEFVVFLGPSGSGKSTLLNILGGLDTATSGQVLFDGLDITAADASALTRYRRDRVGFVFQFYNLIASLTAEENVALVTEIARAPMPPAEALALVGLAPRAHHFPAELSGGEQQRVAIARAIAKSPELLLCDEPTGALDSETGVTVLEALERVNRELRAATVVITHNAGIAAMADRVISMRDGRIAEDRANETRVPPREISW